MKGQVEEGMADRWGENPTAWGGEIRRGRFGRRPGWMSRFVRGPARRRDPRIAGFSVPASLCP